MIAATSSARSTFLKVLLAVSLGFNGCFVVSYWRARSRGALAQTAEGRLALVARDARLTPAQQAAYAQLQAAVTRDAAQFQRTHGGMLDRFWRALESGAADPAQLDAWLDALAVEQLALRKRLVRHVSALMRALTPAQRRACVTMFRYKRPRSMLDE